MKHPALSVALLKKTVTGAVLFAVILSVTGCFGKNGTIGIYTHSNDTLKKIIKYINKDDAEGLYDIIWDNGQQFNPYAHTQSGSLKALFEVRDGNINKFRNFKNK